MRHILVIKKILWDIKKKKGGIGSYALILLILSFLQHHSLNKNLKYWEEDLGVLLTDFFDFYGASNFF